jgi:hypothetical protein
MYSPDGKMNIYINFGENRYGICSVENFLQNIDTLKVIGVGKRGGEITLSLLSNIDKLSGMFDSEVIEMIKEAKGI